MIPDDQLDSKVSDWFRVHTFNDEGVMKHLSRFPQMIRFKSVIVGFRDLDL